MVTLTWGPWTFTIRDDLRVTGGRPSMRRWAQAMIDSHEPPAVYIPDLSAYHAARIADFPGWRITSVESVTDPGLVY